MNQSIFFYELAIYIYHETGYPTGVFIPTKEWEDLKKKYHFSDPSEDLSEIQMHELKKRIDKYLETPNEMVEWVEMKSRLVFKEK